MVLAARLVFAGAVKVLREFSENDVGLVNAMTFVESDTSGRPLSGLFGAMRKILVTVLTFPSPTSTLVNV